MNSSRRRFFGMLAAIAAAPLISIPKTPEPFIGMDWGQSYWSAMWFRPTDRSYRRGETVWFNERLVGIAITDIKKNCKGWVQIGGAFSTVPNDLGSLDRSTR